MSVEPEKWGVIYNPKAGMTGLPIKDIELYE